MKCLEWFLTVMQRSRGLVAVAAIMAVGVPASFAEEPASTLAFSFDSTDSAPVTAIDDLKAWEFLDPATWKWTNRDGNGVIEITARKGDYKPPTRSPGHVALLKDVVAGNCEIRFRVRSTKDTGNHRDCCVFFGYQDSSHFYYCHLGAKPDPHSGQIMIVNEAPRLALTTNERLTPWDDRWHDVLLRRNIDTGLIEVFFDDLTQPHMSVVDKTFGAGRVGIGSFDDMNEFDDFSVTHLP